MTTKVPTMDIGSATLGIAVADTLRRKRKITSTTRNSVSSRVNFTSFTDARIESERSNITCSESDAGSCWPMTGKSLFTASATATVFVPGCFWIASTTARSSMYQAAVLSFSTLSWACATSVSRTGRPSRKATMMFWYPFASCSWPLACTVYAVCGPHSVPVGRLTLFACTALDSSLMPICRAASARGSAWMRTAYFCEPNTCTCATPLTVEMRWAMNVVAYSSMAESGSVGEVSAR